LPAATVYESPMSRRAPAALLGCVLLLAGCSWTEPEKPDWAQAGCGSFAVPQELWNGTKAYAEGTKVTNRQLIADRLVECRVLHGKRMGEVRRLLGKPDEVGHDPLEVVYWIGDERSLFAVDSENLYIGFDKQRRVRSAEIGQG
jgi:hypothetical protein